LAQLQITQAINTVHELEKTITAFSKQQKPEADASLKTLFAQEIEMMTYGENFSWNSLPEDLASQNMRRPKRISGTP